jgi:hypothetical protein
MQCRFKLGHCTFQAFWCLCLLLLPIEIRPDIRAPLAAKLARKQGLYIGQPNVIGPLVAADRYSMAALIIRTIDQETANARGAHFSKGNLLLAGQAGHGRRGNLWRSRDVADTAMKVRAVLGWNHLKAAGDTVNGWRVVAIALRQTDYTGAVAFYAPQVFIPLGHLMGIRLKPRNCGTQSRATRRISHSEQCGTATRCRMCSTASEWRRGGPRRSLKMAPAPEQAPGPFH